MIQIIFGKKGSGKTKRILDMANASVKEAKGNVLFVDDDRSYTLGEIDRSFEREKISWSDHEMLYQLACKVAA